MTPAVLAVMHARRLVIFFFLLTAPAPTEIYTLSLHDALPIFVTTETVRRRDGAVRDRRGGAARSARHSSSASAAAKRSRRARRRPWARRRKPGSRARCDARDGVVHQRGAEPARLKPRAT